jgi:hypothetical protein
VFFVQRRPDSLGVIPSSPRRASNQAITEVYHIIILYMIHDAWLHGLHCSTFDAILLACYYSAASFFFFGMSRSFRHPAKSDLSSRNGRTTVHHYPGLVLHCRVFLPERLPPSPGRHLCNHHSSDPFSGIGDPIDTRNYQPSTPRH